MLPENTIICGPAKEVLQTFPDESINCCISSPPYWALRYYGVDGQLGLEKTFEEYISKLCDIYDEVKRVLRKDGTCFVNLGDTYANTGVCGGGSPVGPRKYRETDKSAQEKIGKRSYDNVPVKSLCLIPQRFAIEMVNRGWILRNVIIWHKPNPMPSSAKDRFTVDFEYVYFFVKSKKYWFDPQYEPYQESSFSRMKYECYSESNKGKTGNYSLGPNFQYNENPLGRNKRTVWTIPTQSFPEAHFATYPEKLVEPMIKAGCPEFICTECGKAREKIYHPSAEYEKCLSYNPRININALDVGEYLKNARIKKQLSVKEVAKHFLSRTGGITGCVWNWENGKALPTIVEWKMLKQILDLDGKFDYILKLEPIKGENACDWGGDLEKGQYKQGISTIANYQVKGYTDCGCNADWRPGVVLDPFAGSGTTLQVAAKLNRNWFGIELKQEYIEMANKRATQGETGIPVKEQRQGQAALFPMDK